MKKIEFEICPLSFLSCALPWFLEHSSMFVKNAIIGMWEFGLPNEYTHVTIDSQKQYKDFFSEYVWEIMITFPALSENFPIANEDDFVDSLYQIYLHYYDGNFLNVWFKNDTLADTFLEHLNRKTIVFRPKERTKFQVDQDRKDFSIWA